MFVTSYTLFYFLAPLSILTCLDTRPCHQWPTSSPLERMAGTAAPPAAKPDRSGVVVPSNNLGWTRVLVVTAIIVVHQRKISACKSSRLGICKQHPLRDSLITTLMQRDILIQQRLLTLWQEVDAVARTSLQRERSVDSASFLNQTQAAAPNTMPGYGPVVQPRVQESRAARRQHASPLVDTSRKRPADSCRKQPSRADGGDTLAVATTPTTSSQFDTQRAVQHGGPSVAKDDLSHDEAASLLMALPMSRGPSDLGGGAPSPMPRVAALPMEKNLSTLSVSGCLSLLDDPDEPTVGLTSPRSPHMAMHSTPRLPGVAMSKQCSTVSVSGFLAVDE